jgi:NAD(P)H-quinone oxidoreductase subunit 4
MLREIFFGKENATLTAHTHLVDAEPREIYVISCLLVPIVGIGLYPRLMTDTYRSSIETLVERETSALASVHQPLPASSPLRPGGLALLAPWYQAPSLGYASAGYEIVCSQTAKPPETASPPTLLGRSRPRCDS